MVATTGATMVTVTVTVLKAARETVALAKLAGTIQMAEYAKVAVLVPKLGEFLIVK